MAGLKQKLLPTPKKNIGAAHFRRVPGAKLDRLARPLLTLLSFGGEIEIAKALWKTLRKVAVPF
jgi:hypothetical protein